MTDEEKKAMEYWNSQIELYSKEGRPHKMLQVLLDLIEKQDNKIKKLEEVLEKKDKIIDAMSDTIETSQYANIDNTDLSEICCYLKCKKECNDVKKECIKQYFEKKGG